MATLVAAVGLLTIVALTGLALAKVRPALQTAKNATVGKTIVVDSHGMTVYELIPETTHHLLCTKALGCFDFWPPVTVKSAKTKLAAAHGVKGKLGILHRNGFFQVTLGGHPLYHFFLDKSKGMTKGDKLHSFKGIWHVVGARSSTHSTKTTTTTTPTTTTTTTPTTPYPY